MVCHFQIYLLNISNFKHKVSCLEEHWKSINWLKYTSNTSARSKRNKTLFGSSNCVRIPINSESFLLCIISSRLLIIDSNLLMIRTVAAPWHNHVVNDAFINFTFSKPSVSCALLKTEALILEYLNPFHKPNTVASTSLISCLNWGIRCTKTNAGLWLRQFTYFKWGASWCSHLCRPDLSPDIAVVLSSPWKINYLMSKPLAQRTLQIFWQRASEPLLYCISLIPSKTSLTWLLTGST